MGKGTSYKYIGTGDSWRRELLLVFLLGFGLATTLWLGLWFVHARPAHTDSLQTCLAEKHEIAKLKAKANLEEQEASRQLEETNVKLEDALLGWGRCIRSQDSTGNQEKASESSSTESSAASEPIAKRQ
jgi:hypothetical protein